MFEGVIGDIFMGLIAIVLGAILTAISLVMVKRKRSIEEKYHLVFWLGLLSIVLGFWFCLRSFL
jgi:hypothetical protein